MNRFTLLVMLIISATLGLLSAAAIADTYRWVDDNGVVNYAERKPRDVPAERVTRITETRHNAVEQKAPADPVPAVAATGAPRSQVPLNANQDHLMQDLKQAEQVRQEKIAKIRQDNCDRSRRVLNNLNAKSRIRVRAEDGTERALGEDERQQRIADAQRGIAENCGA